MTEGLKQHLIEIVFKEIEFGRSRYGPYHNSHEQYGVLKEEVDEWFDSIRANQESLYELIQVAAVALRYVAERGDMFDIQNEQDERHSK